MTEERRLTSLIQDFWQKQPEQIEKYYQDLHRGKRLAKMYAAYRPTMPQALFDYIMAYHYECINNGRQLAVDVCCGTGQSTVPITKFFDQVIGVDVSQDQIDQMTKDIVNLTSYVCPAENMTMIESGSVDLVTIASGLHWTNIPLFFKEAKRILKPGGTFAASSWIPDRLENGKAHELYRQLLYCTFKEYLTPKVLLAMDKYRSVEFPFQDLQRLDFESQDEMTIEEFKGFFHSLHCTKLYYESNPGSHVVEETGNRIEEILRLDMTDRKADTIIKLQRNYFLVIGRNL